MFCQWIPNSLRGYKLESLSCKNICPPDESAKEALVEATKLEAALWRIGRQQPHMEPFITSPIFTVGKKKDGAPIWTAASRKHRQAHHLPRGDSHHLSAHENVGRHQCRNKYQTVQTRLFTSSASRSWLIIMSATSRQSCGDK